MGNSWPFQGQALDVKSSKKTIHLFRIFVEIQMKLPLHQTGTCNDVFEFFSENFIFPRSLPIHLAHSSHICWIIEPAQPVEPGSGNTPSRVPLTAEGRALTPLQPHQMYHVGLLM